MELAMWRLTEERWDIVAINTSDRRESIASRRRIWTWRSMSRSHVYNPYHLDWRPSVENSVEDSVEDILQSLISGIKGLNKCNLTIAFSKIADLNKFRSDDLDVLKAFQSVHVDVSMRLRTHDRFEIAKAASEVEDAGTKLAMSIKSLLKPDNCQKSGPKLTIIRTLCIGEPLWSHLTREW